MFRLLLPAGLLLLGSLTAACACPTALNLIPTADVIGEGVLSLQVESDGYPTALSRGNDYYLLTQLGLREDLEVGFDVPDLARNDNYSLDLKWQFATETASRPALALGFMNAGVEGSETVYYLAASKTLLTPVTRLTVGLQTAETRRGFVGVCHSLNDRLELQVDWTTGPEGCATVGACYALNETWAVLPYYSWSNTYGGEDFMGLNVSWTAGLWGGEE